MMSKRDDAKAILGKYNIDSTEQINALREDTDRREQEMRELPEQINSSAITEEAKDALTDALQDKDKPVVDSAIVALSNIEFMETIGTNEKFAKLTGG